MITERMMKVRVALGLTQREMARRLEITPPAWQHYENGTSVPGGNVLASMGKLGVDMNWLLLGEGSMFRRGGGAAGEAEGDLAKEHAWLEAHGLRDLAMIASTSNLNEEHAVANVLAQVYPRALTLDELLQESAARGIKVKQDGLRATLLVLESRGLSVVFPGKPERFRAGGQGSLIRADDLTGHASVAMIAFRRLLNSVYPQVKQRRGKIMSLEFTVERKTGETIVEKIRGLVIDECSSQCKNDATDQVVLVLGVGHIPEGAAGGKPPPAT